MIKWIEQSEFKSAVKLGSPYSKDKLNDKKSAKELIESLPNQVIILDIGGYFAESLPTLFSLVPHKLAGVVEDTENGHQKYLKALSDNHLHIPVWSVARSALKRTEDYNVGKSLVRAADSILRSDLMQRLEDNQCIGVIGFGMYRTHSERRELF